MELKFKEQQYQIDAVNSLVDCFEGQPKGNRKDLLARYTKKFDEGTMLERTEEIEVVAFGNNPIELSSFDLRENVKKVQKRNDINFTNNQPLDNFSIEMETGTGKTYVYIRSMYELNEKYGWNKFIVMVPSIAIREGVKKSFEITQKHFQELYRKKIRFFVYNSGNSSNIANINAFASDDNIQVMIINYQAFSSKSLANRRIYEELDELQSRRPIDVIKSVRPILIIDEPQKFGDQTEDLFKEFNPLFIVRYSATHKKNKEYNKIHRLDAIDAYNQKLVKKINVKGIEVINSKSDETYLYLDRIEISDKHDPIARMEIERKTATGTKRQLMKIEKGDDLYTKSGELTAYKGYKVSEIDFRGENDFVRFTNGVEISSGQAKGDVDQKHLVRIQIRETIRSHFEKERELNKEGIKVLSLFFIDEVKKYKFYQEGVPLKGEYAEIFEEEYMNFYNKNRTLFNDSYQQYLDSFDPKTVHAGYFSIDKSGHVKDSKINDKKEYLSFDEDAYDLIMKDKERLLSLEEPVRFIFSHSALREGWDNPNIFQICTLKHSNSEISKRQEIGRGLRISVNKDGERMDVDVLEKDFHNVNVLTVVASESYDSFAKTLQKEMLESLSARPVRLSMDYLIDKKEIENTKGDILSLDDYNSSLLYHSLVSEGYIERDGKVTEKFNEAVQSNDIKLNDEFENFKPEIIKMINSIFEADNYEATTNATKNQRIPLIPNENFRKKEFQELWNKINVKTMYEVNFNSKELIEKSIKEIDNKLTVNKTKIKITSGSQKDSIDVQSLKNRDSMAEKTEKYESVDQYYVVKTEYDLIGEITKETGLTRKTIIEILKSISREKFELFKYNPDEFIRKVSNIIEQVKSYIVLDGIKYHKLDEKYSDEIFTNTNVYGELGKNAIEVKKHIYNILVTDSDIEKKFANKLETGEVTVYAKLPHGFKIPTPVGDYNPDWAIVFNKAGLKYVYFVIETKGTEEDEERKVKENAKINFARKHFESLNDAGIKYDVADNYETLMNKVMEL